MHNSLQLDPNKLLPMFEKIATEAFELNTDKWTCATHYSAMPGMFRKHETELAWKAFNSGYELGLKSLNH